MTLRLESVSASYRGAAVFANVSFEIGPGEVLGLIGPNGAGKTTLLRIAAGLIRPRSGQVVRVGKALYFGGESTMPGGCRADRWAALLGSTTTHRKPLRRLSRGTRQMVGLSASLTPDDWSMGLLDEPWEGLDPRGARWLHVEIERHRSRGACLIVSSHRLHDVSALCTSYGFLARGAFRLLASNDVSATGGRLSAGELVRVFDETAG